MMSARNSNASHTSSLKAESECLPCRSRQWSVINVANAREGLCRDIRRQIR